MSLYDKMNEEEQQRPLYEGEEKISAVEVETPEVAAPVEAVPAPTASEAVPTYKYTHWWQSPGYVQQEQQRQAASRERMKAEEKRARWQRNAAIFGDVAKLGAQAYAKSGGATTIKEFTPQTQIANERLAAIRDKHAAQIESFAQSMAAARNAELKDKTARNKAEADYAQADAAARYKAAKDAADMRYRAAKDAADMEFKVRQAEATAKQKEVDRKSRERVAAERVKSQERIASTRAAGGGGRTKDEQELYDKYQMLLIESPEYKVTKMVPKRHPITNFIETDDKGKTVYEKVEEPNPTINQVRNALARANAQGGSGVLKAEEGQQYEGKKEYYSQYKQNKGEDYSKYKQKIK